ncbi:hypothetical protein EZV62_021848 [Acer yangbiense]|uniref:Peptidase A2 domain-containing protein n=1 Tax=Acer yangbiense TaxID=1000413 RepID=A0A5C7H7H1_9ROSI|nr:hypothetical protein EZV62_021848 [Acer yangbiense]
MKGVGRQVNAFMQEMREALCNQRQRFYRPDHEVVSVQEDQALSHGGILAIGRKEAAPTQYDLWRSQFGRKLQSCQKGICEENGLAIRELGIFNIEQRLEKVPKLHYEPISFNEGNVVDVHHPHEDALVVHLVIANHEVRRILVDTGSSIDILLYSTFKRIGLKKHQMHLAHTPLFGFTRDSTVPKGIIELPITVGQHLRTIMRMVNFLVVDIPSAYNKEIGRPGLSGIKVVASIYHLCMKFPTAYGIRIVKGSQKEARDCYNTAI